MNNAEKLEDRQVDTSSKTAAAASSKTTDQRCYCGADQCVGVLGARRKKDSKKKKKLPPTDTKASSLKKEATNKRKALSSATTSPAKSDKRAKLR